MSALDWCHWLENTAFAVSLKESAYLFPIVEGTHLLGMSVSVGLILLLDLRLLRVAFPTEPVSRIMRQVGPWMVAGFGLVFATGLALFAANASSAYVNWFFRLKLALVVLAGLNAAYYQYRLLPQDGAMGYGCNGPARAAHRRRRVDRLLGVGDCVRANDGLRTVTW